MKAVRTTLQNALAIVGVSAPEKCNEEKRKRLVQNRRGMELLTERRILPGGRREATEYSSRWSWTIEKSGADCLVPKAKVLSHRRCILSSRGEGS